MTENEFLLQDRLQKICDTLEKYGMENFFLSFSGGKDSTILHYLLDMAVPNNTIPRVYADTGIEYNLIREFVFGLQENDERIVVIKPAVPIKQMLENEGYPFKSKQHSETVAHWQRNHVKGRWVKRYLGEELSEKDKELGLRYGCPKILRYHFSDWDDLKISDKCCDRLKEDPIHKWQKENGKPYGILGLMREEQGRRDGAQCLAFRNNKLKNFQPLVAVTKEWENWFIEQYDIKICDIYKPPYNFYRTGCKGCPFNPKLESALDTLEEFFPAERKQCEIIWKPVYDEYRKIGYRLKNPYYHQMTVDEMIK